LLPNCGGFSKRLIILTFCKRIDQKGGEKEIKV
jgi:hypothetical protein